MNSFLCALEHLLEGINDYGGYAGNARVVFQTWDEDRLYRLRTHLRGLIVEMDKANDAKDVVRGADVEDK